MHSSRNFRIRIFCLFFLMPSCVVPGIAGVTRAIQEQYKQEYENRAMYLKVPLYGEKTMIRISGQSFRMDPGVGAPRFRVGEQLRILLVDFSGDEIKLRLSGIAAPGLIEVGFKFDGGLQDDFPNRDVFDRAVAATLTEGLRYTEIEEAQRGFVEDAFERTVKELAVSASISRESVLKTIAPQVPAYRDAQREIDGLRGRLKDVSGQLAQAQGENRKLESEARAQAAEVSRLKTANAALQSKIDDSASQISRLGDDLRSAKGSAQGYQRELASIQRSLNLRVDGGRDLGAQIADLGQAMRKLRKDAEASANQIKSLRAELDARQTVNARLLANTEELKAANSKLENTINALTSKENSLARQFVTLTREKEKLDQYVSAVAAVSTRVLEEKDGDGFRSGKADVYLHGTVLGSLSWRLPARLNHGESGAAEASFEAASIDAIRLTAEERRLRGTLGTPLRMRVELAPASSSVEVKPEAGQAVQEVGERDTAAWRWSVVNRSTEDAAVFVTARMLNQDSNEIPVLHRDQTVAASNAVRRVRAYLQPVPLAVGILLGFLLFGIAGIFRRPRKSAAAGRAPADPPEPVLRKKL